MLRKSKKGFTLIELMVVAVIIAVLAVLGLRVYSGQVDKAKNAVVKANVGTIQTLIQGELADENVTEVNTLVGSAGSDSTLIIASGIHNPYTGLEQTKNGIAGANGNPGDVYVTEIDGVFSVNGNDKDKLAIFVTSLKATR